MRSQVAAWLKQRFFLRLHMFWILSGTFLAGLAATNILLALQLNNLAVRYVIAVVIAYLFFLLLIRLWLWYVGLSVRPRFDVDGADVLEIPARLLSNLGPGDVPAIGGGGQFGGGGATGSWGDAVADVKTSSIEAPSGCIDIDDGIVVVVFLLLVLGLLVAGIYMIWAAPAILAEAAFEAALAASLARSARRIDRPGWVGRVWRATIWPFIGILVLSGVLGFVAQRHCPEAKQLRDALNCTKSAAIGLRRLHVEEIRSAPIRPFAVHLSADAPGPTQAIVIGDVPPSFVPV